MRQRAEHEFDMARGDVGVLAHEGSADAEAEAFGDHGELRHGQPLERLSRGAHGLGGQGPQAVVLQPISVP